MGKRTEHAPGTFSWTDLSTTDTDAAKSFYSQLFGWEPDDMPAGEGMTYTMFRLGGDDYVCALAEQQAEAREQGHPPSWLSYVTVEDVDASAARARELGATLYVEPFDVLEAGRMAVVADPQGAVFAIWEARQSIGATRVNDPGCLTWNELATRDIQAAGQFYGDLFGWETEAINTSGGPPYTIIRNGGRSNGGMTALMPHHGDAPPHWLPYFTVTSADDAARRAADLGGEVVGGPMDVPPGRIAAIRDPQGAVFAVFQGEVDD